MENGWKRPASKTRCLLDVFAHGDGDVAFLMDGASTVVGLAVVQPHRLVAYPAVQNKFFRHWRPPSALARMRVANRESGSWRARAQCWLHTAHTIVVPVCK